MSKEAPPTRLDYEARFDVGDTSPTVASATAPKQHFADYVPSPAMKKMRAALSRRSRKNQDIQASIQDELVLVDTSADYRSRKDADEKNVGRNKRIEALATEIVGQYDRQLKLYKRACKYIKDADPKARQHPDDKMKKAMSIARKGPPMTRDQAMKRAKETIILNMQ